MKSLKVFGVLVSMFISVPIAFYLQYKILSMIGATELMWFLFWVNVPLVVFMQFLTRVLEKEKS